MPQAYRMKKSRTYDEDMPQELDFSQDPDVWPVEDILELFPDDQECDHEV